MSIRTDVPLGCHCHSGHQGAAGRAAGWFGSAGGDLNHPGALLPPANVPAHVPDLPRGHSPREYAVTNSLPRQETALPCSPLNHRSSPLVASLTGLDRTTAPPATSATSATSGTTGTTGTSGTSGTTGTSGATCAGANGMRPEGRTSMGQRSFPGSSRPDGPAASMRMPSCSSWAWPNGSGRSPASPTRSRAPMSSWPRLCCSRSSWSRTRSRTWTRPGTRCTP